MANPPIILVPGFWLGAWAWDDVAQKLRAGGHDVTALTLPGLESLGSERSAVSMEDHVTAIVETIESAGSPVVLVVHSGAGFPGYAATDRVPDKVAAAIYVDTGAGVGAMDPDFDGDEYPLPDAEQLAEEENLDGLTEEQLKTFRERAVPQPGGTLREAIELRNDARLDVPTTVICTAFTADEYKEAVAAGYGFVKGLGELRDVTYVDLPTCHWPMWSRPDDLADLIAQVAERAGSRLEGR
ncbi:MAG TPA: alpha/beta hydrolase [Acidimicrobiia bacterium]|nr:alpha/beta hydrolase [Acidimicrobiia bacterium]